MGGPGGALVTRPADVEALKQLALIGGLQGEIELSSGEFARLIDASQQTASRRLIELTHDGLVTRRMGLRRQRIQVSEAGEALLQAEHAVYRRIFDEQDVLHFAGAVTTGLGEGQYYLSRPGYMAPFERDLGWQPFPGTLNVRLEPGEASKLGILKRQARFSIDRFEAEGRTFGGVLYHEAQVNGLPCATVMPNRSHYTNVLELIAPTCLRETIPCADGDQLEVRVALQESRR